MTTSGNDPRNNARDLGSAGSIKSDHAKIQTAIDGTGRWSKFQARKIAYALYSKVRIDPPIGAMDIVKVGTDALGRESRFPLYSPHGSAGPSFHPTVKAQALLSAPGAGFRENGIEQEGSLTESPTRPRVKAPDFLLPILLLCPVLMACQAKDPLDERRTAIRTVLPATPDIAGNSGVDRKMEAACRAWALDQHQVARFFALAREYPEPQRRTFDWLPCTIKGTLVAEGKSWQFEINAASTATWTRQEERRYWACSDKRCESLVLMMPDKGQP